MEKIDSDITLNDEFVIVSNQIDSGSDPDINSNSNTNPSFKTKMFNLFESVWNTVFGQPRNQLIRQTPDDPLQFIQSIIDPILLEKVSSLQELAYTHDKTGIAETECCVCLEVNQKLLPLICKHQLCVGCHKKLIANNYTNCPECIQPLQPITVYKKYATMTIIDTCGIGILYSPPIYDEKNESWKDYDYFGNIERSMFMTKPDPKPVINQTQRVNITNHSIDPTESINNKKKSFTIDESLKLIIQEKYAVVLNNQQKTYAVLVHNYSTLTKKLLILSV